MSTVTTQTTTQLGNLSLSGAPTQEVTAKTPALAAAARTIQGPLRQTGVLDSFKWRDETPVIGRTYYDLDIAAVLGQENVDELVRELAIIIAERNVVFLRNQTGKLSFEQLKTLANKLGVLSGRPAESGLHVSTETGGASSASCGTDPPSQLKDSSIRASARPPRLAYQCGVHKGTVPAQAFRERAVALGSVAPGADVSQLPEATC